MTIASTTYFPFLEEVKAARTPFYKVLKDRSDWGLLFHRMLRPGVGMTNRTVCVNYGTAPYAAFYLRTDLPIGTRMRANDVGVNGSMWYWDGTSWLLDAAFYLGLGQGSIATAVAPVGSPSIGFNRFTPPQYAPVGFYSVGRRVEVSALAYRTSGPSATASLSIQFGGVTIASQLLSGTTPLLLSTTLWVSSATAVTARVGSVPADTAIATLQTATQGINAGITETAATAGNYKLTELTIRVLA